MIENLISRHILDHAYTVFNTIDNIIVLFDMQIWQKYQISLAILNMI